MAHMLTALANDVGMQNVYTPLTMGRHLLFCFAATVIYLVQFYRKGSWHYLLIMAAIDLTFITQTSFGTSKTAINILGLLEALLLIGAFVCYKITTKNAPAAEAAEASDDNDNTENIADIGEDDDSEEAQRRRMAEKIRRAKDKMIIENAFEDNDDA